MGSSPSSSETERRQAPVWVLASIGLLAGFLSGLFGIGGGVVVVPLLVLLAGMTQRLAAGTSSAAILPTAIVGATTYALQGNVNWLIAGLLAIGMVIGAQIGSYLLSRISLRALQWIFVVFLVTVGITLWFVIPARDAEVSITPVSIVALILAGLVVGVLSGLLGIGGGIVMVPILMLGFGSSDLVAKGSSLMMAIPGSLSATLGNVKRKNLDLRAAIIIGLSASIATPFSATLATSISPLTSNILFSILLFAIIAQMVVRIVRRR